MTVYVDNARLPYKNWRMSHLFADTEEELHEFADRLGLKREWFQPRGGRRSMHYDVSDTKRELAFELGALALDFPGDVGEFISGHEPFVDSYQDTDPASEPGGMTPWRAAAVLDLDKRIRDASSQEGERL